MLSIYNESEWVYPESEKSLKNEIVLHTAQNAYIGFQCMVYEEKRRQLKNIEMKWSHGGIPAPQIFKLLPVVVDENTDATFMTTTDYERCKAFVTQKAPFQVYDSLKPWKEDDEDTKVLYIQFKVPVLEAGIYDGEMIFYFEDEVEVLKIKLRVYEGIVPERKDYKLGMMNFFSFENVSRDHSVKIYSKAYWDMYRIYVKRQLEMRCTHIMLPSATPIYLDGKVIDFDFTSVIKASEIAIEEGALYIVGACIAQWGDWTDKGYYLLWDQTIAAESLEGYYQLKLYFSKWYKIIKEKNWLGRVMQSLADEPQTHNDLSYRAIASVFRRFVPAVPIIEAVETFNIGGGVDIWVPKQDTYEKHQKKFEDIKSCGEEMWVYTCAFPAGKIMNRSMDLPLLVSRYILWMTFYNGFKGFLHWGFNYFIGEDVYKGACCPHKGKKLPAGDAHIVYPAKEDVYPSMRFIAQRGGAQDYEIFMNLSKEKQVLAKELINKVCKSFRDYETEIDLFEETRRAILELTNHK